ncbi:MAG: Flp pilus assembly complex ATPase component TadA [Gammaproteobacteria bacterium]|nr:Flp pilus assembly complex ATPase component TadA [Gammaproteobacteria bacterium]
MFEITVQTKAGKPVSQIRCMINHCTIGKSRDNLVQLRGWTIGQTHAEINQTPEGLYIKDLSGGNGFKINDKAHEQYGPIKQTDKIAIGSYIITLIGEKLEAEQLIESEINQDNENSSPSQPDHKSNEAKHNISEAAETTASAVESSQASENTSTSFSGTEELAEEDVQQKQLIKEMILWRTQVHKELLSMMDIRRTDVADMDDTELRKNVGEHINQIIEKFAVSIPAHIDQKLLARDILNEAVGLGPLEELLEDDSVTEIMVNSFDDIFIERNGRLVKSVVTFSDDNAVLSAIERIVSPLGRRIDESSPMVDARLKDGSRVNAIIPPLALRGPCLTIRKFSKNKLTGDDLVNFGSCSPGMMKFLQTAVHEHCNIVISGGTGSGKTTLLNVLSNFIPHEERVITVEDAAELKLNQPHLVSLESRPANLEGKGAVPIRDLVKNCLRMRPDRIVVGECRGGEALDMLQAMNTGHDGSLTTAHANTPRDVLSRLEVMVMMAGMDLPLAAIREQVSSAVDIIVQQTRLPDGSRRVTYISEITGIESGIVQVQDIFLYKQTGYDDNGKAKGKFIATGLIPYFYENLRERGVEVDMSLFTTQRKN